MEQKTNVSAVDGRMTKRNKIIYWIATLWMSLGMVSTGMVQVLKMQAKADFMTHLGYPDYFLTIVGLWKIPGILVSQTCG